VDFKSNGTGVAVRENGCFAITLKNGQTWKMKADFTTQSLSKVKIQDLDCHFRKETSIHFEYRLMESIKLICITLVFTYVERFRFEFEGKSGYCSEVYVKTTLHPTKGLTFHQNCIKKTALD
jgi:hypothetical protein